MKELAYPFSRYINNEISYDGLTFEDLINRYYQDKNLRRDLFHCIEKIEVAFKTKFAYILGNKHGAYGYLKFDKWVNKKTFSKIEISKKQDEFKKNLSDKKFNTECIREHFRKNSENEPYQIPIWMLVEKLTFGEILQLYKYMSYVNKKEIANSFDCTPRELDSWLNTLKFVRNQCAHNSNIIDIRLKTKPKLRKEWFEYIVRDNKNNTLGALSEIIIIMVYLTTKINKKYKFNDIQRSINSIVSGDFDKATRLGFKNLVVARSTIKSMGGNINKKRFK